MISGASSRRESISSSSSSSTELCDDEHDRLSDFDSDAGLHDNEFPVSKAPVEKIVEEKTTDVLSPESVDNALCCDNSQASGNSSISVSPIELDDATVPCDKSVLIVREVELNKIESKTETNELSIDENSLEIPSDDVVHRSRSPQMETVITNTEALIDIGKRLNELKTAKGTNIQDNHSEENDHPEVTSELNENILKKETNAILFKNSKLEKDLNNSHSDKLDIKAKEIHPPEDNTSKLNHDLEIKTAIQHGRNIGRRSSSDQALLKILNENSEILNRIQSRRNSSSILEDKLENELKPWKTFDKQRSLDMCQNKYEKQNTKWFSSSVDFSSMKLGSFGSKLSFETIDESKELRNNEETEEDTTEISSKNNQYSEVKKEEYLDYSEKTKFGIPNIAEEVEQAENGTENIKPKSDIVGQKKPHKIPFNPFPSSKITARQNKEVGIKLGLYSPNESNKNKKS